MALFPAIEYFHHTPMKLPWPWTVDIDKVYGGPAHHYCPSRAYAKHHLQPRTTHWPLVHHRGDYADVQMDNHKFVAHVDVAHFSPDELRVHFTSNNWLIIEGKHEEKTDAHGSIERHFKRRYQVPADVNEDDMRCRISSDGILTVYVPRETPKLQDGVKKVIPIQVVNGPAVGVCAKAECDKCEGKRCENGTEAKPEQNGK